MIIAIHGKINSGKDTVAKIIQYYTTSEDVKATTSLQDWLDSDDLNGRDFSWKIKKFADKLKDIVCLLIGCTREQLENREFKENELGEEWVRYGYANGFFHIGGNTIMNNEACSKERYEEELITNWQTAYKGTYTPRKLLQYIGTDLFRKQLHNDVWVNSLFSDYNALDTIKKDGNVYIRENQDPKFFNQNFKTYEDRVSESDLMQGNYTYYPKSTWIITDMRFPNEFEAVKERKGICIKITRPTSETIVLGDNTVGVARGPLTNEPELLLNHASETSLDHISDSDWDYIIQNDGSIIDLIEKVREILFKEKLI